MARRYDLHRLKRAVSITEVLAHYGLDADLRRQRGELVGPCPLPGHDGDRDNRSALRVHVEKGVWHCLTHCGGGDVVKLVALLEGGDYAAAARSLAAIEDGVRTAPRRRTTAPPRRSPTPGRFVPYTKALRLRPEHPLLRDRGVRQRTARTFEAGWWPLSGWLAGCVGVRLHDPQGRPLGYAGRRVDPDDADRLGKWKMPSNLPKADLLFNWHRARPHLERGVVVVEGPFDAMRVWQAGWRPVVALLGTELSAAQRALLATAPRVLVMLDGDDAGRHGARRLVSALASRPTYVVRLPQGRDPADLDDEALRLMLASFFS